MAALARDHPKIVSERPRQRLVRHLRLADIALARSDHDAARSGYQQAWIYTPEHPPGGWQGGSAIAAGRRLRAAYWEGRADDRED